MLQAASLVQQSPAIRHLGSVKYYRQLLGMEPPKPKMVLQVGDDDAELQALQGRRLGAA